MHKSLYLISYDVTDNKIRRRILLKLSEKAFSLQRSVFLYYGYLTDVKRIKNEIIQLLDDGDKLLCITVNSSGFFHIEQPQNTNFIVNHEHPILNEVLGGS